MRRAERRDDSPLSSDERAESSRDSRGCPLTRGSLIRRSNGCSRPNAKVRARRKPTLGHGATPPLGTRHERRTHCTTSTTHQSRSRRVRPNGWLGMCMALDPSSRDADARALRRTGCAPTYSREHPGDIGRTVRGHRLSGPEPRLNFLFVMLSFQSAVQATEGGDA